MDDPNSFLIELVRVTYPEWDGVRHPEFVAEEIIYKRQAVSKAAELLERSEMRRLLTNEDFDELFDRIDEVARSTNLLWIRGMEMDDLAALRKARSEGKESAFYHAIFELLYGTAPSTVRLQDFVERLEELELPNKWTLPTYFLFLHQPNSEIFVKPSVIRWYMKWADPDFRYQSRPSKKAYDQILRQAHLLLNELSRYEARDMIDIQSILWVAASAAKENSKDPVTGSSSTGTDTTESQPAVQTVSRPAFHAIGGPESGLREGEPREARQQPAYPLEQCATELHHDLDDLSRWVQAIRRKRQAILYGPPGTGKTHVAKALAKHLVGGGQGLTELVQFHPSYAYEDFIQGIRPRTSPEGNLSYEVRDGRFLDFCRRARERSDPSVLIIDEINRANLARVFGELMYLLEYRDEEISLAAGGERFSIPRNVYILGTMNTADRSIALIDAALRRRFAFIGLQPNPDILRSYHEENEIEETVESLIGLLDQINDTLDDPHHSIGITYFLHPELPAHLEDIWRLEIVPYLEDRFYDRMSVVDEFRWEQVRSRFDS